MLENSKKFKNFVTFFFEAGILRFIPRSGYTLLGSGKESVAEHSYRTTMIGYILAQELKADVLRTCLLCLFHDFPEARTGDLNYLNQLYVEICSREALEASVSGIEMGESILELWDEYNKCETLESIIAHDADQLDLALNLRVEENLGNSFAKKWLDHLFPRLKSDLGRELYKIIITSNHTDWWYKQKDKSWWEKRHNNEKKMQK